MATTMELQVADTQSKVTALTNSIAALPAAIASAITANPAPVATVDTAAITEAVTAALAPVTAALNAIAAGITDIQAQVDQPAAPVTPPSSGSGTATPAAPVA